MELVSGFIRPEDYDFGDFYWVEQSPHEPEGFAVGKGFLECPDYICAGEVEAEAGFVRLAIFDVDVIFGIRHIKQSLLCGVYALKRCPALSACGG